jgi:hypothetical protein
MSPPSSRTLDQSELHDLLRGVAQLADHPILRDLAGLVAHHVPRELSIAFNHKQLASKQWLVDTLAGLGQVNLGTVWILGAWYGVLGALILNDPRLSCHAVVSVDLDPSVGEIAERLNRRHVATGRFRAFTADMMDLRFEAEGIDRPGLIINTSCEHLHDVPGWVATLPKGVRLVLQSNDYVREPDHVSCVADLDSFQAQVQLATIEFAGALPAKNYTRLMLIGAR